MNLIRAPTNMRSVFYLCYTVSGNKMITARCKDYTDAYHRCKDLPFFNSRCIVEIDMFDFYDKEIAGKTKTLKKEEQTTNS